MFCVLNLHIQLSLTSSLLGVIFYISLSLSFPCFAHVEVLPTEKIQVFVHFYSNVNTKAYYMEPRRMKNLTNERNIHGSTLYTRAKETSQS